MRALWRDLLYSINLAAKRPSFTWLIVATLAVGIGSSTAIFSVVNGVLLRPLPYSDPEDIVTIWQNNSKSGVNNELVSPGNFLDFRNQSQLLRSISAAEPYSYDLTGDGEPERISAWLTTFDFFEMLGVHALHGRVFTESDGEEVGSMEHIAVLTHQIWQRRFGSDPSVVGQRLLLDGEHYTIIGILPREFRFYGKKELFTPRRFPAKDQTVRTRTNLFVVARLASTLDQASDEMNAIASRLAELHPDTNKDIGVTIIPIHERFVSDIRPAILMLVGAVAFVLAISCANVANLLLFRGNLRLQEFATRTALGARRGQLARQLFAEAFLLSLTSSLLAIFLAYLGIQIIKVLPTGSLPGSSEITIDLHVLLFSLGLAVATALLAGVLPLLPFSNLNVRTYLRDGGIGGGNSLAKSSFRQILIVAEIALALILLIGGGLLMRSFTKLLQVELGFTQEKVAALEAHLWSRYPSPQQRAEFFERVLEDIAASPGVEAAAAVSSLPLFAGRIDFTTPITIAGRSASPTGQQPFAYQTIATADFFKVMKIPLIRGRFFNGFDRSDTTLVVLINETLARRYWPDKDPVGQEIEVGSFGPPKVREIVGIVADVRHSDLKSEPRPEIYIPHLQNPSGSMTFIARSNYDSSTLLITMKTIIWKSQKDLAFARGMTIEQIIEESMRDRQFNLFLVSSFAGIALFLVMVGISGVIGITTSRRTREIGLRMALGAGRSDILRMLMKEELLMAVLGVALGSAGAIVLTRFMRVFLYGVSPTDPITFGVIPVGLILLTLLSIYIPAQKASKIHPAEALRCHS